MYETMCISLSFTERIETPSSWVQYQHQAAIVRFRIALSFSLSFFVHQFVGQLMVVVRVQGRVCVYSSSSSSRRVSFIRPSPRGPREHLLLLFLITRMLPTNLHCYILFTGLGRHRNAHCNWIISMICECSLLSYLLFHICMALIAPRSMIFETLTAATRIMHLI